MIKIKAKWCVSKEGGTETLTLNDLGLTEKQWSKLKDREKQEFIIEALDHLPEQPFMQLDSFEEI